MFPSTLIPQKIQNKTKQNKSDQIKTKQNKTKTAFVFDLDFEIKISGLQITDFTAMHD